MGNRQKKKARTMKVAKKNSNLIITLDRDMTAGQMKARHIDRSKMQMIPGWMVISYWMCDECGGDPVGVPPSWYEINGTPTCECGRDMRYMYTATPKKDSPSLTTFLQYYDERGNWLAQLEYDSFLADIEEVDKGLFSAMMSVFPVDNSSEGKDENVEIVCTGCGVTMPLSPDAKIDIRDGLCPACVLKKLRESKHE